MTLVCADMMPDDIIEKSWPFCDANQWFGILCHILAKGQSNQIFNPFFVDKYSAAPIGHTNLPWQNSNETL